MTVSATVLTGNTVSEPGTSEPTASISVAADRVQLVFLSQTLVNGVAEGSFPNCSVSGLSRTWDLIRRQIYVLDGTYYNSINVFRATGIAATGALTLSCATSMYGIVWDVIELTGANTSGENGVNAIVQSNGARGSGTALSVTLNAFAQSNNAALFYGGSSPEGAVITFTPGSGLTEISDRGISSGYVGHTISFRSSAQTTLTATASATGYGTNPWGAIGIEIADVAVGSLVPTFPASKFYHLLVR